MGTIVDPEWAITLPAKEDDGVTVEVPSTFDVI